MKKIIGFTLLFATLAVSLPCLWAWTTSGAGAESPPAGPIKHVNAEEARALLQEKKEVVVLDIRTPAEFEAGHIAAAKNVDFKAADFERQLGALDRRRPYLVHCASGRRSESSLKAFEKLGFESVYHLDGGIKAWQKAGYSVVK